MQRSTFKVLFYVKRQSEKSGQVPIMGRITINGTMSQFSCKLTVRSSLWDAKANKASGKSLEAQRINEKLENIKTNIGKQYQRLCDRDSYVTAEKVRNAFLGTGDDCRLLLQTFDEYLADFRKRVGKAGLIADYETYGLEKLAAKLDWGNSSERAKKVKSIREIRKDAKAIVEKNKEAQYQLAYLLNLFPNLSDIIDCEFNQLPMVEVKDISDYDTRRQAYRTAR